MASAPTPGPDNHSLNGPHSLSAAFTTNIDPDHRPKSSELLELYELLIKGQLEESLPQFDSLRKVKNAVNDHEGMSFFIRAFEEHPTLLHKLRVATGKIKGPSRRVKRRVKVSHVVSEPNLYPKMQKAPPQRKVSLDNLIAAPPVTKQETELKESSEYITLNELLKDLVALLAGNAQIIIRITNQCLSHGVPYNNSITNSCLTPYQRATHLITSLLALVRSHSKPNEVFSSLIAVLQKVGLTLMANQLLEARKSHAESSANKQQQLQAAIKDTIPGVPNQSGLAPTPVTQLKSKYQVANDIEGLYSQFTTLVSKLRVGFEELVQADRMKLNAIARTAALYLHIPVSTLQAGSIEELLQDLEPHYDFFNFNLLQHLANSHLSSLPIELTRYIDKVNKFSELSQLRHIRTTLHGNSSFEPTSPITSDRMLTIAIKLDCSVHTRMVYMDTPPVHAGKGYGADTVVDSPRVYISLLDSHIHLPFPPGSDELKRSSISQSTDSPYSYEYSILLMRLSLENISCQGMSEKLFLYTKDRKLDVFLF
uniref:Uncharacterized protein n=1 Tax=Amphimedon queenslandica TaxID=400682 RepID=A0A1X7ULG5_AMPQE